jgi:hypothetical protein
MTRAFDEPEVAGVAITATAAGNALMYFAETGRASGSNRLILLLVRNRCTLRTHWDNDGVVSGELLAKYTMLRN